ncbi:HIT-like domain-containing protein [Aspergillus germanicus]
MPLKLKGGPIHFGPFLVTPQVFHQTSLSFALVNLKPILPGHVLVSPRRVVPRVSDLTVTETTDLFLTVRRVGRMIERVYGATSLNIAIQDGTEAGQSVPHVHAHIIPRRRRDLSTVDAVYDKLDGEEGDLRRGLEEREGALKVDDEERIARGAVEMEEEAIMLATEMEKEPLD